MAGLWRGAHTQGTLHFRVAWEEMPPHLLHKGTLHVYLDRAADLTADSSGLSDPCVKLTVNGKTEKSRRSRDAQPAVGRASSSTALRELIASPLQLAVFDYDFLKKDDPLGNAIVDLSWLVGSANRAT